MAAIGTLRLRRLYFLKYISFIMLTSSDLVWQMIEKKSEKGENDGKRLSKITMCVSHYSKHSAEVILGRRMHGM